MHRAIGLALLSALALAQCGCCSFHKKCSCRGPFPDKWCSQGCGPLYWSEWHNDPPDCHDPCNRCGNYVGRGCPCCSHAPAGNAGPSDDVFESRAGTPAMTVGEEIVTPAGQ
jgi:hypothetical protein